MPIVKVNDDGKEVNLGEKSDSLKKWSRRVALVSSAFVLAGIYKFVSGDVGTGLMVAVLGSSLASIWNLADD